MCDLGYNFDAGITFFYKGVGPGFLLPVPFLRNPVPPRRLGAVGGYPVPRIHRSVSPGPVGSREGSFRLRGTS